jgi:nitrile hydratase accessory protein
MKPAATAAAAHRTDVLDPNGPAAPPRQNGELVFQAPWESRLFGLTICLHAAGLFDWDDFRRLLIEEIRAGDGRDGLPPWSYYERWQAAFEKLLAIKGLCRPDELRERIARLEARPAGHDH